VNLLEQMIARDGLSTDGKRIVLAAVADLSGQYDRRQVLTAYIVRYGVEPALREPFFATIRSISSNYDRREALTALAKKGAAGTGMQDAVFDAVAHMTSDYDRAEVLLAFVPVVDAATRPAFVSAAESIKSSHDQNRVLAALVKAERR
jgi:hypothetical protein